MEVRRENESTFETLEALENETKKIEVGVMEYWSDVERSEIPLLRESIGVMLKKRHEKPKDKL